MSELQIGLLAIGALVVAGVLAYNRIQERRARVHAEAAFRSAHPDILIGAAPADQTEAARESSRPAVRAAHREPADGDVPNPDAAIDYVIELRLEAPAAQLTLQPALQVVIQEHWAAIARRHAHRALIEASPDGALWRAGLQLVSRDGPASEAELIEFRSAVETLAAAIGASIAAPEMRAAVEQAREIDAFCAESDIQVVLHVIASPGTQLAGTKLRTSAEAAGLALEADGRFALRNDEQRLLYTLAARDGAPFAAETMKEAAPQAVSLAMDLARAPDSRRSFESMARLARQLASVLGGSLVDDNGQALDEKALAAIAQQLDAVRGRMEARGMPPGGALALRLFS